MSHFKILNKLNLHYFLNCSSRTDEEKERKSCIEWHFVCHSFICSNNEEMYIFIQFSCWQSKRVQCLKQISSAKIKLSSCIITFFKLYTIVSSLFLYNCLSFQWVIMKTKYKKNAVWMVWGMYLFHTPVRGVASTSWIVQLAWKPLCAAARRSKDIELRERREPFYWLAAKDRLKTEVVTLAQNFIWKSWKMVIFFGDVHRWRK